MITTMEKIKAWHACEDGWDKLVTSVGSDQGSVSLKTILKSNGIVDAIWALRCFEYKDQCLFLADVAESVLHLFEEHNPDEDRPRLVIEAIRAFHAGTITEKELKAAGAAAYVAATGAAARAAAAFVGAPASYVVVASMGDLEGEVRKSKWAEIEELFIKYFCE